ncbi:MAG: hypothetical protein MUO85_06815 [candidate division Zixibacteria bacterium]|nr:hypothetical protein [candidate division Zixibacteria bacterium]
MAFRQKFSLPDFKETDSKNLTPEQEELLHKVAQKVVRWKMSVPAILFLESVKPLNYLGSQMMVFFEPFVQTVFTWKDYDQYRIIMEERENVEKLLQKIEELDAIEKEKEKEAKKKIKEKRKNLPWGKRIWSYISGN